MKESNKYYKICLYIYIKSGWESYHFSPKNDFLKQKIHYSEKPINSMGNNYYTETLKHSGA